MKYPITTTWSERKVGRLRLNLRVPAAIVRRFKLEKANRSFKWIVQHDDGEHAWIALMPTGKKASR